MEINGDEKLGLIEGIKYLILNTYRNIMSARPFSQTLLYNPKLSNPLVLASPSRYIIEDYMQCEIFRDLESKNIDILEVGCGSGRMSQLLSYAGVSGNYTGIDIAEKFCSKSDKKLSVSFKNIGIHQYKEPSNYDLIFSISALEHIPHIQDAIDRMDDLLTDSGIQVHAIPSGWALALYLFHGHRQFPLGKIHSYFNTPNITRVGGVFSFMVHFIFITLIEMVLKYNARKAWPNLYSSVLKMGIEWDKYLPFMSAGYIIITPKK